MQDGDYHRSRAISEVIAAETADHPAAVRAHRKLARLHAQELTDKNAVRELALWVGPELGPAVMLVDGKVAQIF